jgi:RNA polymerase sigma factor (sigma-70 family)
MAWFHKNGKSTSDAYADMYQEAFFIFFEKVRLNELKILNAELSTFLIAIGKNLERDVMKSAWVKKVEKYDTLHIEPEADVEKFEIDILNEKVTEAMSRMGERCRLILELYYYRQFSMEAIAQRLNLKNESNAKKNKYECLKKLKAIFMTL